MKTLKKGKEKKVVNRFKTLNVNELLQIRGGDGATIKDGVL